MRPTEPMLTALRPHFEADADLHRIMLNSTSWLEASLALGVLTETVPTRALITCANVREVIKELPRCPMPMSLDFESLARIWGLQREQHAWARRFADSAGEYSIALLGDGNYLYDIVVRAGEHSFMLMPPDRTMDFVSPEVLDLMIERPAILGSVVDLTTAMGLPFYPMFYMSLEDWQHEYAAAVFGEIISDFDRKQHELPASVLPKPKTKTRASRRRKKKATAA